MLSHHQVAAATRIGMLTRERDTAAAGAEALRLLAQVLPSDTSTLTALDPLSGAHVRVAGDANRSLTEEFVGTSWYDKVLTEPLPLSISDESEPGQPYLQGRFYEEHVRPAGFRDGMSGALYHRGRHVGMIHLATEHPGTFTREARHLLASVLPALAALADPADRIGEHHGLPDDASATLVTPDGLIDLPGRDRPPVLGSDEFLALLKEFDASGGRSVRLLWPMARDWYRVVLARHTLPLPASRPVVLVHARPTAIPYGLSPREIDVLTRAAMGHTNQAIAQHLFLSPRTVHTHVEHMLRKTGTSSRAEATALAVRDGLLRPAPGGVAHFVEQAGPVTPQRW
ncbi:response regulator transcription factor [Streptomyces sp. MBT53]|uniref:response regulator transcription factor n=1 Tax=Streptomyces sp. MBT53 TaxID=1488384 RepID=UPI001911C483|nr:LuxR C-terminal-related transcriptional regulator [Streptomyces sp. MBT53]MBK6014190.1 response regulator transcription factor [Streptomyces sp. MBT53]